MCCLGAVSNAPVHAATGRRARAWQTGFRVALLFFFAWLAGRFWHPYYGFTRFLQLDELAASVMMPELRAGPLFVHRDGYDGHYYAQLAASPSLAAPELAQSMDNLGYRARRILLSWLAWLAGLGDAVSAARAYAWLNLVVWAALAAVLWRLWPARGWRETLAWAGVLFSAGALHSVRLALTDLLALLLVVGAIMLVERGRSGWATVMLGLAGLTRETALLAVVALAPSGRAERGVWLKRAGRALLCVGPLALWMLFIGAKFGWQEPGAGNFAAPFSGWGRKWLEAWHRLQTEPDHGLAFSTLLAHVGLTVQACWLLARWRWADAWWRVGAGFALLMLVLSGAVWEGHPGAATRVLLPLAVAFNVVALRAQARAWWLVGGNLSVLSGVIALWEVPESPREIAAGRAPGGAYVALAGPGWHQIERHGGAAWVWSPQGGEIELRVWPRRDGAMRVAVSLAGVTPREFTIAQDGAVLARGTAGLDRTTVEISGVVCADGVARIRVASAAPPQLENPAAGGRELGLALHGVRLLDF
jgi:hypothetical protein